MKSLLLLVVLVLPLNVCAKCRYLSCDCGWTNSDRRMVGGDETLPNEYPWSVSLQLDGIHFCGGSIITPWHALTAAHCIWGEEEWFYDIRLVFGAHNLKIKEETRIEIPLSNYTMHDMYNQTIRGSAYDICILVTERKIPFNKDIGPVCMPTTQLNLADKSVKHMGWGRTEYDEPVSSVLLEIDIKVLSKKECYKLMEWKEVEGKDFLERKVCAYTPQSSICKGDSGSALVWLDPETKRYTEAALASYTWGKCPLRYPYVNTDVSSYIDWINKIIQATKPGVHVCSKM